MPNTQSRHKSKHPQPSQAMLPVAGAQNTMEFSLRKTGGQLRAGPCLCLKSSACDIVFST